MIEDIRVPEIGEKVESGEVVGVLVKKGDRVAVDDIIIELETEKATVEIPSPFEGRITEVLVKEGDPIKVGDVIARVDTGAETAAGGQKEKAPAEAPYEEKIAEEEAAAEKEKDADVREDQAAESNEEERQETLEKQDREDRPTEEPKASDEDIGSFAGIPASPSVRRLARELGVNLKLVQGSAPGGRISENDIKAFKKKGDVSGGLEIDSVPPASTELPDFSQWGEIESVELSKIRRLTAESTSRSWRQVPHVTQFDQADITDLSDFITQNAEKVRKKGARLTITAVLIKVCAEALKKFPQFNASIDTANQKLILKKYVHIGVMVATARGLMVPVIRNADRKTISELAIEIVDLADQARSKKIKLEQMQGGTFSISNQGGIGGTAFTPIVLWPQAAILGVSRSSTVPIYRDAEFTPRESLPLSLSYDHRIIDGADAARFLRWICESLEQPFTMFLE